MIRTRQRRSLVARAHREHPEQLSLDLFPDEPTTPTPSDRPYSSWPDMDLQALVVLDVHQDHYDEDLRREYDGRVSAALLGLFENLGPDSDGVRVVLHPGLKKKLEESAGHLRE